MKNFYPEKQMSDSQMNIDSNGSIINNLNCDRKKPEFGHQSQSCSVPLTSTPNSTNPPSMSKSIKPSFLHHSDTLCPNDSSPNIFQGKERRRIFDEKEGKVERRGVREEQYLTGSSMGSNGSSRNGSVGAKSSRLGSFIMSVTLSFIISLTLVYYFSPFIAHHLPTLSPSSSSINQLNNFPESLSRIQNSDNNGNDVASDDQFTTTNPEVTINGSVTVSEAIELNKKVQMISMILPDDSVVVSTKSGKVLGYKVKELSTSISIFLGIPYARPPVGAFRFKKPRPVVPWKGLRDATRFGHQCIQYKPNRTYTPWISSDDNMSEDCLTLNIWAPNFTPESKVPKLKPVMLWIHGGAFFSGSSDVPFYDGRTLAAFGDVVVVTINYRLGALGFYDARIIDSPGNQGLYDQLMAMKWVYENIQYFGGDPELITLFGQSAGAISIGLHYLSPLSQRYFKRVILESGSPTVPRIFYERDPSDSSTNKVPELARKVGCLGPNEGNDIFYERSENIVSCLRRTDLKLLESAQNELIEELSLAFGPTSGDDFLPDLPMNILHDKLDEASSSSSDSPISSSAPEISFLSTLISHSSTSSKLQNGDSKEEEEEFEEDGDSNQGNAEDRKRRDADSDESGIDVEKRDLRERRRRSGSEFSQMYKDRKEEERMRRKKEGIEERSRDGSKKELLIGVNKDEGSFFLHFLDPKTFSSLPKNISYEEAIEFVKKSFNFLPESFSTLVTDMFLSWTKEKDSVTIRNALAQMIGDSTFTCPATLFANLLAPSPMLSNVQESPSLYPKVYFYVFDHSSSITPWDKWMGVLHFDEVPFVFGHPVRYPHVYTKTEISFSQLIMNYWVNFAKTGSPSGKILFDSHSGTSQNRNMSRDSRSHHGMMDPKKEPMGSGIIWPIYTKEEPKYLSLNPFNVSLVSLGVREETCSKWRVLLENS